MDACTGIVGKLCELPVAEQEAFLNGVAQRGAIAALTAVGLNDAEAISDVRDLRDVLRSFRVIRKQPSLRLYRPLGVFLGDRGLAIAAVCYA